MGLELSLERSKLVLTEQRSEMRVPLDAQGAAPSVPLDRACRDPAAERDPWTQYAIERKWKMHPQNPHEYRGITMVNQTATLRRPGPLGLRQSMPSRSIESCARVRQTVPSVGLRPDESSSLQTLGKQTQTIAIPPQKLYDVASASAKHEDVSGERLLVQARSAPAHSGHRNRDA